jgi:hypothetical protein
MRPQRKGSVDSRSTGQLNLEGERMMRGRILLMWLLLIPAAGCTDLGEPPAVDLVNQTGTIVRDSAQFYLIRCDTQVLKQGTLLFPLNLTDPFKRDGLRIRFSGNLEVDPLTQYLYPPLRLTAIEELIR